MFFSDASPLRVAWQGFDVREEQRALAGAVETALQQRDAVALEAPTGTGKTLAYLVPALLHSGRVIVSVGNRTLQDHLWWGEYRKLRTAVPGLRSLTVLKGCENYLCRWRLDEGLALGDPWTVEHAATLAEGLRGCRSGDIAELPLQEPVRIQAREKLTVTADQCLGVRCSQFEHCYFQRARRAAMEADVLLINHTLLLSDQRLFEKGMGALLPTADAIVVDEAHQLPDLLVRLNTETLEGYRLQRWIRQVRHQCGKELVLFPALKSALQQLEQIWATIQRQLSASASEGLVSIQAATLTPLLKLLLTLDTQLRHVPLASVQLVPLQQSLTQWRQMLGHAISAEQVIHGDLSGQWMRLVAGRVQSPFATLRRGDAGWVFLSATLAVEGSFDYFKRILDLPDLHVQQFEGHLDYRHQALLWVPEHLPEPASETFMPLWVDQVLAVAGRLQGGVLMLFSSFDALELAARCIPASNARQLLVQQPGSDRQRLLEAFRQQPHSLLLATGSFWEGIDLVGASLRCIAIDKLPFTPPDDVLALAWQHLAAQQGKRVFQDYMVPQAVTRLRQGIGRLLRSPDDRGLILLGDTRLLRKAYGRRFMASLPPVPMAADLVDVEAFLHRHDMGITPAVDPDQ